MTSTTMMRWWLWAVLCSRSMASVAMPSAVSKPKVMSVPATSLSMVLGRVMTFSPCCLRRRAFFWVPPPPRQTRQSSLLAAVILDDGVGHVEACRRPASVRLVAAGAEDGAAEGEDARQLAAVERTVRFSIRPRKPSRKPITCMMPW
jgi:hypothetical protein